MKAVSPNSGILEAMKSQVQRAETFYISSELFFFAGTFCCCFLAFFFLLLFIQLCFVFGDLVSGEITGAANGLLDAAVDENVYELGQSSREADDGESRQGGAPGRERGAQLGGKIIFLTNLHCFAHRLQESFFL